MGSGNDSILDMYLYETNTLLEQLDGILLAAEQADTFSQDSVNEIFRIMHTIKGSSAMMEFPSLMTVAHRIEDLFFIIREKGIDVVPETLRPELFDMLFQAVDFFRGEIEKVENGQPLSDSIDSIVDKINSLIDKIQGGGAPAAAEKPASGGGEAPESAAPAAADPSYPFGIQVFCDEGSGMENLRAFMLLNGVKDYCADYLSVPEYVENDPTTSEIIADQGFFVWFHTAQERDSMYAYDTRYSTWAAGRELAERAEINVDMPVYVHYAVPLCLSVLVLVFALLLMAVSFKTDPIYLLSIREKE